MRVLVTGATGFIGYHTAKRLRAEGHSVRALVRSPEKAVRVLGPLGIDKDALVVADMGDGGAVDVALEGCDSVVHAAASVSVTNGSTNLSPNLRGTETVVGRACERGLYSIFVSSVTANFDPKRPVTEDSALVRSKTLYGRSKAECDGWASEIQTTEELDTVLEKLRSYRAGSARAGQPFGVCAALRDVFELDGYRAMAERGVTELITVPWLFYGDASQSCVQKCDGIRRFADEIITQI